MLQRPNGAEPGTVAQTLEDILGNPDFSRIMLEALAVDVQRGRATTDQERLRKEAFDAMVGRVAKHVREQARAANVYRFLEDQSRLTEDELVDTFEFIYSHLVNHFKGEIAETLARSVLRDGVHALVQSGRLPAGTEIIPGADIQARQVRRGRSGWYKAADALLALRSRTPTRIARKALLGGSLVILGLAEVKSYRPVMADVLKQLRLHVRRLRLGVRVAHEDLTSRPCYFGVCWRGRLACVPLESPPRASDLVRLIVCPGPRTRSSRPLRR